MRADIVIPVWNQLELTKDCINSIIKNTSYSYGLVIIDNASDAQTKEYLQSLKEEQGLDVTLIRNETNLGFVKAVNQGIRHSHADYVCLLNNDTEVASGWLSEMIKVAELKEPKIGIVNANSNTLGARLARGQRPEDLAATLKRYSGEYSELALATGFCMLIKRQVIDAVGLFDETYGMGNFEDADFSKRAQELGYFIVCAKAAYVYHKERRSFALHRKFDQNFRRNREIFHAKWGKQQRILYVVTEDDPEYIEKIIHEAAVSARSAHIVWIFFKGQGQRDLKIHSNVYVFGLPVILFNWFSFWRIIKRKKKFDKIYVDNQRYKERLKMFKLIHKAEVITLNDKFQIPNDK